MGYFADKDGGFRWTGEDEVLGWLCDRCGWGARGLGDRGGWNLRGVAGADGAPGVWRRRAAWVGGVGWVGPKDVSVTA